MKTKIFAFLYSLLSLSSSFAEEGIASYYTNATGSKTASGERFNHFNFTAAHRKLPFGTKVKVVNLENKKHVIVKINDRGPFVDGRVIDLSLAAAKALGFHRKGLTKVKIYVL